MTYTLGDTEAATSGNTFLQPFECHVQVQPSAYLGSVVKWIALFLATKNGCYLLKGRKNNTDEFA